MDRTESARGLLRLTGPQRIWFLQQTITADVEDLPSGQWRESAFLTPKGKLVAHFRVGVLGDDVWVDIDPPTADPVEWFTKFRFRTKVEIEDRSTTVATYLGPDAASLVDDGSVVEIGPAGIAFGDRFGEVGVAVVHGDADVGDRVPAPEEAIELARVEAGVARFGVDYTTDHLPQEAGLSAIVPVDKGCYVGQETVARIHFRGHVNRVVRPLELRDVDASAALGRDVFLDGIKVGTITSAVRSPSKGAVGIAMVRVEPPDSTPLEIDGGGYAIIGPVPEGTKVKTS